MLQHHYSFLWVFTLAKELFWTFLLIYLFVRATYLLEIGSLHSLFLIPSLAALLWQWNLAEVICWVIFTSALKSKHFFSFFFPTEPAFYRFMKKIKTQERFEFLIITSGCCRSSWEIAQAAPGGQCGIRDAQGGRSSAASGTAAFPEGRRKVWSRRGGMWESIFEELFSPSTTQSSTDPARCGTVRAEPWWEAGRRKLNTTFSCSSSSLLQ